MAVMVVWGATPIATRLALDRGGIARTATLQFLQPVSGFVLAALVLRENVTVPIRWGAR